MIFISLRQENLKGSLPQTSILSRFMPTSQTQTPFLKATLMNFTKKQASF